MASKPKPPPTPPIRILSIDPAGGISGWSVLEYYPDKKQVVILRHGLIKGEQVAKELKKTMMPAFSRQYTVLCAIRDTVAGLVLQEKPDYVACEGPFAHRFVAAYASLKLVVDRIRQAVHQVMNRDIYEMQPTEVKMDLTGKGTASKDEMREALLSHKSIVTTPTTRLTLKDAAEHEIDAIGVGYSFIKRRLLVPPVEDKK